MEASNAAGPPPEVPPGWQAVWNNEHKEWFYANIHTSQTTWDIPTDAAVPSYNALKLVADPSLPPAAVNGGPGAGDPDELPSYKAARQARKQNNLDFENEILSDYDFEDKSAVSDESLPPLKAWSRKNSCRVLIKRYSKTEKSQVAAVQRELNALYVVGGNDEAIPALLDYFDPADTVFVVCETRQDEPLKQYIEGRGPLNHDLLKSVVTQLMSALSIIFTNGFAHLKMSDETLYLDAHGQLTVRDFQYAVEYGKQKTDTLYAAVGHEVKGAEGIWCAPEVFAAEKEGVQYNGRKAVMWTCGVAIYYMATGQLEKLSNLDHPVFMGRRSSHSRGGSIATSTTVNESTTGESNGGAGDPSSSEDPQPQARRFSLLGHRRRSSAAAGASSPHNRKPALSNYGSLPTPHTLITYPGNRLEVPSYARDIISKMLLLNPYERAELIEVAAKVPKEVVAKSTRPLMELAWQDYKDHVGPYAGMGLGADEFKDNASIYASSTYSGLSNFTYGISGFLGKKG